MRLKFQNKGNALMNVLLAGILLAVIGLIAVILFRGQTGGNGSGAADEDAGSSRPPVLDLEEGDTLTRNEAEDRGSDPPAPSRAVDTQRVEQTYQPGRQYRSLVQVSVQGRGDHKEWGINATSYMQYVGEAVILRTIESNNGNTLVLVQEFEQAKSLSAKSEITSISIGLPRGFQMLLDAGGTLVELPPGWTELSIQSANRVLDTPAMKGLVNKLNQDATASVFAFVDSLDGKKVRITYVNGEGVTRIEPLRGSLDADEQDLIMATSVISDAYVLPDLKSEPGDTWTVYGQDMLPVIDPSLRATVSGALTARRGENGGTPDRPTAEIIFDRGVLSLHDADGSTETTARWAPRGRMTFDFTDQIVTYAELDGEFQIQNRSTDHWIFETRFNVEPEYEVVYQTEVVR